MSDLNEVKLAGTAAATPIWDPREAARVAFGAIPRHIRNPMH